MKKFMICLLMFTIMLTITDNKKLSTVECAEKEKVVEEMERIWIPENEKYVPFIVLEKTEVSYLLMREYTAGSSPFVYGDSLSSYYGNSALDDYLNTEYARLFSDEVKAYLLESDIVITKASSIGCCGGETEIIHRVFYVPSWTEATGMYNSIGLQEGNQFPEKFKQMYLATENDKGEPVTWWLRTPDTWDFNRVFGINEDGGVFVGSTVDDITVYEAEVRPVFRVSIEMPIVYENGQWYMRMDTE